MTSNKKKITSIIYRFCDTSSLLIHVLTLSPLSVSYSNANIICKAQSYWNVLKYFHIITGQYIYIYIYIYIYAIAYLIKYLYLISNFYAPYMYIIIISLNDTEINHSYMYT